MRLLLKEITYKIIGCALEVHKVLGSGYPERIYQRALAIEFANAVLKFEEEFELIIYYKGCKLGLRRIDFLLEDRICVEIKAIRELDDLHLAQAINYVEASNSITGLLINFGAPSLEVRRIHNRKLSNLNGEFDTSE